MSELDGECSCTAKHHDAVFSPAFAGMLQHSRLWYVLHPCWMQYGKSCRCCAESPAASTFHGEYCGDGGVIGCQALLKEGIERGASIVAKHSTSR